ncbi:sigma-70 family RNA polymerase sigma factor [Emcibacter sp. SYSU 3D8]|uniref:sigma-70 family RNA polymerase sigma factor n=1 Tax=Emcibacter sp. SYSU 3D8 TaxID=3133969 RepID=UPI0031FF459D
MDKRERDEIDRHLGGLMASAQAGDQAAYDALLHASVPLVRAVARGRGVPPETVDDVVQETLLTIHRARHTYDPTRSFRAWLRTIADRRAIDLLRRQGRQRSREVHDELAYASHADPAPVRPTRPELDGDLRRAVDSLPDGQRQAVEELTLKDRTLAEAAMATGRSQGALKVNLHRALKSLRTRLSGWEG